MTRKEALTKLLEKVEQGHAKLTPVVWFMPEVQALELSISGIARAYNGSMDAALGLREDLLPGSDWFVHMHTAAPSENRWHVYLKPHVNNRSREIGPIIGKPSRALLIAILKALIEGEE